MERRSFNKKAIIASAWIAPTVSMVSLPSHAQATATEPLCVTCSENRYVAVPEGATAPTPGPVGPEGSFDISNVCIDSQTTMIEMVATNNNSNLSSNPQGLLFDEALNVTVTRPDGSTVTEGYTSFNATSDCFGITPIEIPSSPSDRPNRIDVSHLFKDASGQFILGTNHQIAGRQCNVNLVWNILSFDFVVTSAGSCS